MSRATYPRPWCVEPNSDVGEGTQHPLSTSGVLLSLYLLRIKTIRVQIELTAEGGFPTETYDETFGVNTPAATNLPEGDERNLACGGNGGGFSLGTVSDFFFIEFSFVNALSVYLNSGNYYPYLTLGIAGGDGNSSQTEYPANPGPSAVAFSFFSQSIPMFTETTGRDPTGFVIISAPPTDGYYEYRDADGLNPLYDKDTGDPN